MNAKTAIATITLCGLLMVALGCGRAKPKQPSAPPPPVTFAEATFTSFTPTADGGAYAVSFDSGLWYMRGAEAVKVRFPDAPVDTETFFATLEIIPLIDGGAYVHSLDQKSLWHLHEGSAEKVRDVQALSSKPVSSRVNAFPLYVVERKKRLEAERERDERPNPDDAQSEPDE